MFVGADGTGFGVLLRSHRTAARLTQEELAAKSGLSIRAVGDLERGRTTSPYRKSVARLADALALSGADLAEFVAAARAGWAASSRPQRSVPAAASAARTAPFAVTPRQLPAAPRDFVGRDAELTELNSWLDAPAAACSLKIAVVSGVAGVGKTGLALHWSHSVISQFPDGQLYADLRGYDASLAPLPPGPLLDRFLRALGVPVDHIPEGTEERAALFRSMLHGKRVLVVLDNARSARDVRPLLPGSGTCFVLVSSRNKVDDLVAHNGARLLTLEPLAQREAGELLSRMAGDRRVDPETAERIAALCDRLPLALRIAAARLAMQLRDSASDLVSRLTDEQRRLQELSRTPGGVRVSFGLSYRELPAREAMLFRHIGLLDASDFAAWAAAALLGEPEQQAEERLEELVRAGLIETAGVDCAGQLRYRLHDLMRLYARERCLADDPADVRDQALHRLFGSALHLASEADQRLGVPFVYPLYGGSPRYEIDDTVTSRVQGRPALWFEAERNLLTNAVRRAARLGEASYAWELTNAQCQFFFVRRHLDAWRECATLAAAAAKAASDHRGEAAMLLQQADLMAETGHAREAVAIVQQALALVADCGDMDAQAVCLTTMTMLDRELGHIARAKQHIQRALTLHHSSTPRPLRDRTLTELGVTYLDEHNYVDAADCFRRFLRRQKETGCVRGQAEARYRLGQVRLRQGHYATAAWLLTLSMRSAVESADDMTYMVAQIRLGQALVHMGKLDQAHPLLDDAVQKMTAEKSPRFRAIALETLGQLHGARGHADMAAPLIAEADRLRSALPVNAPR